MDKVILYKCVPHGWSEERSYLVCEKVESKTTYGSIFIRYKVLKRWSCGAYKAGGSYSESLKGLEYNDNELSLKIKYNLLVY